MEYKGYKIVGDGSFGMKVIKPLSRGTVPLPLRGKYTGYKEAQTAIDTYEATKDKGRKNGKTTDQSRD